MNSIKDNLGGTAWGTAVWHVVCARHGLKHSRGSGGMHHFFSEVNSIRGNLGGHGLGHGHVASRGYKARHEARPCGKWCV